MQILAWNAINEMLFGLAADIYNSVAKTYALLLSLIEDTNGKSNIFDSLSSIYDVIYVLIGIFMLFRITVSFINMLIDPDKVSDKQAGAGATIKRVAISIVLLIIFQPSSFAFDMLDRIENALVDPDDGLISNITGNIGYISDSNIKFDSIMFEDVEAADASSSSYDCYYINASKGSASASGDKYNYNIDNFTHIKFSNASGSLINGFWGASTGWHVESYNDTQTDSSGRKWTFTKLPTSGAKYRSNQTGGNFNSSYTSRNTCPPYIIEGNGNTFTFYSKNPEKDDILTDRMYFLAGKSVNDIMDKIGVLGGDKNSSGTAYTNISSFNYTSSQNADAVREMLENYDEYIRLEELDFAQTLFDCFVEKLPTYNSENDEVLSKFLYSNDANSEVYDLAEAKTPQISINYFLSIIVGLVVIVYLLLLSVEVIIRGFKLAILKVMAPIPIISYIDPKDKVFNNWIKMFFTVYIELFIKLICISLAVALLDSAVIGLESMSGFTKLLYIVAVFVFIKAIPTLINKIFGIDMSGSSFKEIGKMAKTALAVGAGAAIGAGAALGSGVMAFAASSGQGVGNRLLAAGMGLKNVAAGALRGAGGGLKGKVTGGLSAAQANMKNRNAFSNGLSAGAIAGGALFGGIGMDYAARMDREMSQKADKAKRLKEGTKAKSNMDAKWESSDYYKSLAGLKNANGSNLLDASEMKTAKKLWMKTQMGGGMPNANDLNQKEQDLLYKLGQDLSTSRYTNIAIEDGKRDALNAELIDFQGRYAGDVDLQEAYHTQLYREALSLEPNEEMSISEMRTRLSDDQITEIENKFAAGMTDYEAVSTAEAGMNHIAGVIGGEISRIKGSAKYREAAAVREMNKNK